MAKTVTLEAVKEQFCTQDKREALEKIRDRLDDIWDIEKAAQMTAEIGERMEEQIKQAGKTWTPAERILWTVREAFILGFLDMATNMMVVNDMGYKALAGEGDEA